MRMFPIAARADKDVTEATLRSAPSRALTFLQGAIEPAIAGRLATVGWSVARVDEAWNLLLALRAVSVGAAPKVDPVLDAIAECEAWQSTGLVRARAMLQLSFPEQAAFMFHDFVPGKGMAAVLNVATCMGRLQALGNSAPRKASRKVDHAALALLDATYITKSEVRRLEGLVGTAHRVVVPQADDDSRANRLDALRKIHAWVGAWSEIARTVITRRDHLIRLGIAKRRSPKPKMTQSTASAAVRVTPSTAAPSLTGNAGEVAAQTIPDSADERAPDSRAA
jgi:hypothetical protein